MLTISKCPFPLSMILLTCLLWLGNTTQNLFAQVDLVGKVQAVSPNLIRIADDNMQIYFIGVNPKTAVVVTGSAEPTFLSSGLFVEFTAEVDKQGQVKDPIEKLTVFIPTTTTTPGIFPEGDRLTEEPPSAKNLEGKYLIRAQIRSYKNDLLQVNFGKISIKGTLAPTAQIILDLNDHRLAQPGDKIEVKGNQVAMGQVTATKVSIYLEQPLEGQGKKQKKKTRSSKSNKNKSKTDEDDPFGFNKKQ